MILSGSGKSEESSLSGNDSGLSSRVRHVPVLAESLDPLDAIVGEVEEDERVGGVAGDDDLESVDLQKNSKFVVKDIITVFLNLFCLAAPLVNYIKDVLVYSTSLAILIYGDTLRC